MKQYSIDLGKTFQEQTTQFLAGRQPGQRPGYLNVTIIRKRSMQTGSSTSWTATCRRISLSGNPNTLNIEALANIAAADGYEFLFPAGTDIQAPKDLVVCFDGTFRVVLVTTRDEGDSTLDIHAFAIKTDAKGATS